jgi:hypothetical protein
LTAIAFATAVSEDGSLEGEGGTPEAHFQLSSPPFLPIFRDPA